MLTSWLLIDAVTHVDLNLKQHWCENPKSRILRAGLVICIVIIRDTFTCYDQ